jgi:hypothetical protein
MERFLTFWKHQLVLACIGIVIIGMVFGVYEANAGSFSGHFTGYAMGNMYNCCGHEIRQSDFANHSHTYCPGDPASN